MRSTYLLISGVAVCTMHICSLLGMRRFVRTITPRIGMARKQCSANSFYLPRRTYVVPPEQFKGVDELFDNKQLSPLNGVPLFESGYLYRLYQTPIRSSTTKLLNDPKIGLFHALDGKLRPTRNKTLCGYSLTPRLLGRIVGALYTNQLQDHCMQQRMAQEWVSLHQRSVTHGKLQKKHPLRFFKTLCASLVETQQGLYLPHFSYYVLLSFLYAKAEHKIAFIEYMQGLQSIGTLCKDIHPEDRISFLHNNYEEYDYDTVDRMVASFDQHNAEATVFTQNMVQRYYGYFLSALMYRRNEQVKGSELGDMPQIVEMGSYSYMGMPAVATCTETALFNVVNFILADGRTGTFSPALVPHITFSDALHDFYNKLTFQTIHERSVGKQWMHLVSNIPGVVYKKEGQYEVRATKENFLLLLNHLFNTTANTFEIFFSRLSNDICSFSVEESIGPGSYGDSMYDNLTISVTYHALPKKVRKCIVTFKQENGWQHCIVSSPNSMRKNTSFIEQFMKEQSPYIGYCLLHQPWVKNEHDYRSWYLYPFCIPYSQGVSYAIDEHLKHKHAELSQCAYFQHIMHSMPCNYARLTELDTVSSL